MKKNLMMSIIILPKETWSGLRRKGKVLKGTNSPKEVKKLPEMRIDWEDVDEL